MSQSIYVGNLPWEITEQELTDLFSPFGEVSAVKMVNDHETGRFRGFSFVEMENGANEAIQELNGRELMGRPMKVNEAFRKPGEGGPGGGPRGGGGFRGGDRGGPPRGGGGFKGRGGDRGPRSGDRGGPRRERRDDY